MDSISVFTDIFCDLVCGGVEKILLESAVKNDNTSPLPDWSPNDEKKTSCAYCRIKFDDLSSQREHYKLDWHRYNIKQSLIAKSPITEEQFNDRNVNDDLSSISGSDSEVDDTIDSYATAKGKFFLQTNNKRVISIYKCLLFDRKEQNLDDNANINQRLNECCLDNRQWTVLMLGGGHFAGAVFKGGEVLAHKTFHCYTVRAGQGGSQSSKDNKSGGSHPKSAGASLRRYNELSFAQHIRNIVEKWGVEINESSRIFYRAAGPSNRSVLFGGQKPIIDRNNEKLRIIPFSTRRATFTEVKRVHSLLSTVEVYESLDEATRKYVRRKSPESVRRTKVRSACINRAKSREIQKRILRILSSSSSEENVSNDVVKTIISRDMMDISNELIMLFNNSDKNQKSFTLKDYKLIESKNLKKARKKMLMDVVVEGDLNSLKIILAQNKNNRSAFINQILDENLNTSLHVAALHKHTEVLTYLLENDADPTIRNKRQQTAFTCTQCVHIKETLKHFAEQNPLRYNYNKAQIPVCLLNIEETLEKANQRKLEEEKENNKRRIIELQKKKDKEKQKGREKARLKREINGSKTSCNVMENN